MVELLTKRPNEGGFCSGLGTGDMVFSFFSSVSYNLEGKGRWGSRFPRLLLDLCDHGIMENKHLDEFQQELKIILYELQKYPLSAAVYDITDLSLPIPWEVIPGEENNNLAQPWVTPRNAISYWEIFDRHIHFAKRYSAPILLVFPTEEGNRETLWDRKNKGHDYWVKDKG